MDSVTAWNAFCEQLKGAGAVLAHETTPKDDLSQAEGLRKLVRMIRMGFEATLEYGHTDYPEVYQLVTPTTLGEGETADSHYHQAMIDGAKTYRVTGTRGEAPFIELTVYAGKIGLDAESEQVGAITESGLAVKPDGTFELILSPEPHEGNWIRTTPQASVLFIREYTHDWGSTRGATYKIRREGIEGPRPPIRLEEVQQALGRTASYVGSSVKIWADIAARAAAQPPNLIVPLPQQQVDESPEMPTGHRFSSGYFRLAPDEALVVEFNPAEVPYWGLDFTNFWFETLSYEDHRSHVNNRTAVREADGTVRVVIGAQARGARNWVDTLGHREGMMMLRWSRTDKPLPVVNTKVVKLESL